MLIMIYITFLGLMIGSAINAIVWRLFVGRSWVRGRSMCPECKHELAGRDLIPVVSWLWLRGRCRYCQHRIHWQYPLVELLTAALFGLSAWMLHPTSLYGGITLGLWLVILTLLLILAVYDARWMVLPDTVIVPAIVVGAVLTAANALHADTLSVLVGPVTAAIAAGGFFLALVVGTRGKGMGAGDIKLVFLMGIILGIKGTALALLVAFNVAAVVGVTLIILRRKGRKSYLPFGPYLIGATVLAFLYGRPIVDWYLAMNGLL